MAHTSGQMADPDFLIPRGEYGPSDRLILEDATKQAQLFLLFVQELTVPEFESRVLVSVDPTAVADAVGLPVNFGPGRGNWVEDDLRRLWTLAMDVTSPVPRIVATAIQVQGGDLAVSVTGGGQSSVDIDVRLVYFHSVNL